jgi:hypothetical protein
MTPATDTKPTRRVLSSRDGQYVVELRATLILIRPKGSRVGGKAEVAIPVGAVYQRGVMVQLADEQRARRRGPLRVKRGIRI